MIRITCPCCGVGIKAEDRLVGQDVRCPKCLSPVKVQSPGKADLAKIVEPNYEPQAQEDDQPKAIDCPKCGNHLRVGEYLCKKCGYHVKLEAFFEVLTSESLAAGTEPKTKMERWLETQLHELSTPRDFMIASALCALFFCLVAVIVGRIFAGPLIGTILGLIASGGIALVWYVLMQRLGVMNDPKREERLARQRSGKLEKIVRDPGKSRGAEEKIAKPVSAVIEKQPQRLSQPAEYDVDDIDLFDDTPVKRKKLAPAQSVGTLATENSPSQEKPARKSGSPASKPAPRDDDWLNDLL